MKSSIIPIEDNKKTITAIVRERIREAILSGELPAGSRLDQAQLANDLQVSLVPVREALKALDAEGFVKIIPRRGAFVADASTKDIEDLYFARQTLEGDTAFNAANHLSEDNLDTLQILIKKMTAELQQHDYVAFMSSNRQFHFTIYSAVNNQYLLNMITALWDLAERYRFQYIFVEDHGAVIQDEHQKIFEACVERDQDKLREAIVNHMQRTLEAIKQYWRLQQEKLTEERS